MTEQLLKIFEETYAEIQEEYTKRLGERIKAAFGERVLLEDGGVRLVGSGPKRVGPGQVDVSTSEILVAVPMIFASWKQ